MPPKRRKAAKGGAAASKKKKTDAEEPETSNGATTNGATEQEQHTENQNLDLDHQKASAVTQEEENGTEQSTSVQFEDVALTNFRYSLPRNIIEALSSDEIPGVESFELASVSDSLIDGSLTISASSHQILEVTKYIARLATVGPNGDTSLSIVLNKSAIVQSFRDRDLGVNFTIVPGTSDFRVSIKGKTPEAIASSLVPILRTIIEHKVDLTVTEGALYSTTCTDTLFSNTYGKSTVDLGKPFEQKVNIELRKFVGRQAKGETDTSAVGGVVLPSSVASKKLEERAGLPPNDIADLSTENGLFQARNLVNHLSSRSHPASHSLTIRVHVPTEVVGGVIGKSGTRVLEMKRTSGTYFHFEDRKPNESVQTITMHGTAEQLKVGISLVYKRVESELEMRRR